MARSGNRDRCIAGDEEMVKAAWDTARDMELEEGVMVVVRLFPTAQRGVWHTEVDAVGIRSADNLRPIASVAYRFPNGSSATLSAFLFSRMNILSQMVSSSRASALAATWGREERRGAD